MLSRNQWLALLVVSLLATLTFITIPRYPYLIDDALSEKAVLSYAHQHHFQFGKDIVFTYGPLGFLVSRYFFLHAAGVRMATDFVTCFASAIGLSLLAWRLTTVWRWLLVALFIFLCSNIDPRADLVLYIGLFGWALLCFLESNRTLALCASIFICLAVFSVLVKANFLVLVGFSSAAIVLDLVVRRKFRAAVWMALGMIIASLAGWIAAGQNVANLPLFFRNSVPIILGYDQTVGLDGLRALQNRGWLTLPLISIAAAIRTLTAFQGTDKGVRLRRALLFGWTAVLLFIIWKHSFVRAGLFHGGFYFGLVPILALALEALPCSQIKARNWARAAGGLCCIICIITLQSYFFLNFTASLFQPIRVIPANLTALLRPDAYTRQMMEQLTAQLAETKLARVRNTVGHSSLDVFGQDQVYAVLNDLNYHPRPIFQSYMAYNSSLANMNEKFYFSKAAPEYVLFRLTPIDRHYAPLEDSAVFRDLLLNYQPIEGECQFLLLKRKSNTEIPILTLLREGSVHPGEPISLSAFAHTDLWLQIDVNPTLLGRARQFFYKPTTVRLAIWRDPLKKEFSRFRAPTPMLAAGFVASPVLANTEDAINLYTDCAVTRPYACSVELGSGNERFWQQNIHYRIYKIKDTLGRSSHESLPHLLSYAGFQTAPTEIAAPSSAFVRVETQPAFSLPLGGVMRFTAPKGTTMLQGKFGLGTSDPNVQPADFRIEEEMPDGTIETLQSQVPTPGDYGLKPFAIALAADKDHKLILRTAEVTNAAPAAASGELEKKQPLSCWADIRFN